MSEAVQDAVVCPGCGKSYRAKPELAGKKAKCKCGQTVRFPAASAPVAPAAAGLEPVDGSDGSYDVAAPVKAVVVPTAAPVKMGACKGCKGAMPAGAVLCTRCGLHQKTGKKMGTQVQGEGTDAGEVVMTAGKVALSIVLGGVIAIVGTVLWFVLMIFVPFAFVDAMALVIGASVAWVIRLLNPNGTAWGALTAAGYTILSIGVVKLVLFLGFLGLHLSASLALVSAISLFDILWLPVAVITAYRMAAGLTR